MHRWSEIRTVVWKLTRTRLQRFTLADKRHVKKDSLSLSPFVLRRSYYTHKTAMYTRREDIYPFGFVRGWLSSLSLSLSRAFSSFFARLCFESTLRKNRVARRTITARETKFHAKFMLAPIYP